MNVIYKSKSQIRKETEAAVKKFLKTGGSIEVVKARKAPKQKMRVKSSRGFVSVTSGFATVFPSQTLA